MWLIKAMEHVLPARPRAHLVIVGDGPARRELAELVRTRGLDGQVTFTGMIKNDRLLASGLLGAAKVFATASTSENQPMTILEAMIFGLPIVGVNARGVPEMIQGNGFVCPPEDPEAMGASLLGLLSDEEMWRRMSAVSKQLAAEYSIERTTDRLEKLYWEMIELKQGRIQRIPAVGRRTANLSHALYNARFRRVSTR